MSPFTAVLHTIILLGVVQGFIMSGLLFFSKAKRYASRLLAAIVFFITLAGFNLYGNYMNWFGSDVIRFIADLIPLVVVMPFGPLLYFYIKAFLNPGFTISKKQRLHFLPAVIDVVPSLTVITFIAGLLLGIVKNQPGPWGNFIDTYNVYADIPRWISVTVYLVLSMRYLAGVKAKCQAEGLELPNGFAWLRQLTRIFLVFQCIWLVFLVPYIMPQVSDKLLDAVDWYPIYIPMAVMVYLLGIKGYNEAQYKVITVAAPAKKAVTAALQSSSINISQVETALETAMQQDKLYLNPNLTVEAVAQHIGQPAKTISAVLNQHLHKSFNEYINSYRVAEFKEKILLPGMEHLTIAGIAAECGFNSQATFQRTFKQVTGMSPTEYRKRELAA